jgi:hypothetical protein
MYNNPKEYKYTVEFNDKATGNTGIGWQKLIKLIYDKGIDQVKTIRFHHPGCPNGKSRIDGDVAIQLGI